MQATSVVVCLHCAGGKYTSRISAPSDGLLAFYAFSASGFIQDSGPLSLLLESSPILPVHGSGCLFQSCAEFQHDSAGYQSLSIQKPVPIAGSAGFSICLWYSPFSNVTSGQTLFGFHEGQLFAGRFYESEDLIVRVYSGNILVYYFIQEFGFSQDEWKHICLCLDSNGLISVYLNGTLRNEPYKVGNDLVVQNWTSNLIGRNFEKWSNESSQFQGLMGEFRIYDRQLSQEEILELHAWRGQSYNATSCALCTVGHFSSAHGATTASICELCDKGTYASLEGSTVCQLCEEGKFLPQIGSSSSDLCALCYVGTYSDSQGSANCTECPEGTSCDSTGAKSNSSCDACPAGKTSATGAAECRKCSVLESCYNWQCPEKQYRKGDICSTCSICKNISIDQCSAYSDTQCAPCAGSSCSTVETSMILKGFETIFDFQIYGTAAFKISIASALGGGLSPADVVISQVCDSTGSCSAVRRVIHDRRSSVSDVTVSYSIYSDTDPSQISAKIKMSNFSTAISSVMSAQTNRTVNATTSANAPNLQCQADYYVESSSTCIPCSKCSSYLVHCGSNTDAVCSTTSQTTVIVAAVAAAAGVSLIIVVVAIYRWNVLRKRAVVSRRLMEVEVFIPGKIAVMEQDLPWALRQKYEVRGVLGRGAFGVVLEALDKQADSLVAIKLVFPVGRQFTNEELNGLQREVRYLRTLF